MLTVYCRKIKKRKIFLVGDEMQEVSSAVEEIILGMRNMRPHIRKLFSYATDMSDAEMLILSLLYNSPDGKMLLSTLHQELTPVRASKLTNITNKLEDKGYVKKQRLKSDRRKVVISITPKGKHAYEKFEDALREVISRNIDKLTEEERETLKRSFLIWMKLLQDI